MPNRVLRVGLAQLACEPYEPVVNADITTKAVASAAEQGAQLVILPELAATSYVLDRERLAPLAEEAVAYGSCLHAWSEAARQHGVAICGGFVEREGDRLFNSVAVFDPTGSLLGTYRKLHLFGRESAVFEPGDHGLPVFEVAGVRLGILVCYDLRFPEAMRILALEGAEVIGVPTAWVAGFDRTVPDHGFIGQVQAALVQANLNQVYVACADQVGTSQEFQLLGRSVLGDPFGDAVLGPLDATRPAVVVHELRLDELEQARHRGLGIDPLQDRRTDVYGPILGYTRPQPHESVIGGTP